MANPIEKYLFLFNYALNNVHESVFLVDRAGRFQYVNDEACRILGYSREELLQLGVGDINPVFAGEQRWREQWPEIKASGTKTFEGDLRTKAGELIPVEITANYFSYDGQEFHVTFSRDITERKRALREHEERLRFLTAMDRVNRAIQGGEQIDEMLRAVLEIVFSMFQCDCATLIYPCDPDAAEWSVPMEYNRPEFPGFSELKRHFEMREDMAERMRLLLAADGPVQFGSDSPHPIPPGISEQYGVKSFMGMALYPRVGAPWQFSIQQCSHEKRWTPEEARLFQEIGWRVGDSLSVLLEHRDLLENRAFLDKIVENIPNMLLVKDAKTLRYIRCNHAAEKLLGISRETLPGKESHELFSRLTADSILSTDEEVLARKALLEIPEEIVETEAQDELILHTWKIPILDESGDPAYLIEISEDITWRKETEESLHQNLRLIATVFARSVTPFALLDRDLKFIRVNEAFAGNYKMQVEDFPGRYYGNFLSDDTNYRDETTSFLNEIIQSKKSFKIQARPFEFFNQPERGTTYWDWTLQPIYDDLGELEFLFFTSIEATERVRAEKERQEYLDLLESLDRINRAIQGAGDLDQMMSDVLDTILELFSCDRATLIYPCDPVAPYWQARMERTRPGFPGALSLEIMVPTDRDTANLFQLLLESETPVQFGPQQEHPVPPNLAAEFNIHSQLAMTVYPKQGEPWMFVIHQCENPRVWSREETRLFQEIGRRIADGMTGLLIMHELRKSEVRLRSIFDTMEEGVIFQNREDEIIMANPVAEKILGTGENKLVGRTITDYLKQAGVVREDDSPFSNNDFPSLQTLRTGKPQSNVVLGVHRFDGTLVWISVNSQPLIAQDQARPYGVVITFHDITRAREAEAELRRYKDSLEETVQQRTTELIVARDAAEAANKAKSVFLANMSHELRTPLNAILGFSRMMSQDSQLGKEQRDSLDIINRSGEHLLQLINDVLEMARIEAGKLQLEIAPFDLVKAAQEVLAMMKERSQEKGLRLFFDRSEQSPRFIRGDEARLRQILINLLSNGVKFTEKGNVTLRLRMRENDRTHLVIEVEDTGTGIRSEDRKRLFVPFEQISQGQLQYGTGLGLTITRQFVVMMGGTISVESEYGKGSLFRIDLPVEQIDESDLFGESEKKTRTVTGLAPGQPPVRVLIAEDQQENRLLLENLMRMLGIDVRIAEDGRQCIQVFQEWHPDLIWMDRRMPVLDGIEATRRIRSLPGGDRVKIIAVTASAFEEEQKELLDAGMDDCIRKPYQFDEIYGAMAKHLGLNYVYSDEGSGDTVLAKLTPDMLKVLSPELCRQLQSAVERLDTEQIHKAIELIEKQDPVLAQSLLRAADHFDYPTILDAIHGALSGSSTGLNVKKE